MYLTILTTAGIYVGMYHPQLNGANVSSQLGQRLQEGGLIIGQLTDEDRSPVIVQASAVASVTAHIGTGRQYPTAAEILDGAR